MRPLSDQFGVSIATVISAQHLLENQGYVLAVAKSGYYVQGGQNQTALPQIATGTKRPVQVRADRFFTQFINDSTSADIQNLATAVPHHTFLPVSDIQRAFPRTFGAGTGYFLPPGYLPLRQLIARRMNENGCNVAPDHVVITNGAQEALSLILDVLTVPGDVIALESPTYYGLLQAVEAKGLKAIEIPTNPETGMLLEDLERALNQWPLRAVLCVPQSNNPLGFNMPDSNKLAMLKLIKKYDVPLIEDDVYGELAFSPKRPRPVFSFDEHALVYYVSSFSKTVLPGLRVGWLVAPQHRQKILHRKYLLNHAVNSLSQIALANYLRRGGYVQYLKKTRIAYQQQLNIFSRSILECFPCGVQMSRPSGGFVLWIELQNSVQTMQVYEHAIREKICFAPGPLFSSEHKFKQCMRFNCAIPWTPTVAKSILKLGQIIKSLS